MVAGFPDVRNSKPRQGIFDSIILFLFMFHDVPEDSIGALIPWKQVMLDTNYSTQKLRDKISDFFQEHRYYWSKDKNFLLMKYLARFIKVRESFSSDLSLFSEALNKYTRSFAESQISTPESVESILETIGKDGYYQGLKLSEEIVEEFLEYAFSHACYANRIADSLPIQITPEILQDCPAMPFRVASYIKDQESCPLIQSLAKDPKILAIAEGYLGRPPVYHTSELLWSFPHKASSDYCYTHFFHSDINDYRNIKFFFYLTDVDVTDGSHHYIKGSHKKRAFMDQLKAGIPSPKSDQRLIDYYGEGTFEDVTGPAGFGFIGDPYTLHRGSDVASKPRLFLQIEFMISSYDCWYYNR
ncbi:MAG: hypothetical protein F6K00_27540 [Leptolyngbya sp. SIOISBB]|nr:hypothetical protein [Leptolyngbya sp. SIOISBB]